MIFDISISIFDVFYLILDGINSYIYIIISDILLEINLYLTLTKFAIPFGLSLIND